MPATPELPLLKRVPPGARTALAWCLAMAYPSVVSLAQKSPIPVYSADRARPLSPMYLADRSVFPCPPVALQPVAEQRDLVMLALSSLLAFAGCALLLRRPAAGIVLLLSGSAVSVILWDNMANLTPIPLLAVYVGLYYVTARCSRRASRLALALVLGALLLDLALVPRESIGLLNGPAIGAPDANILLALAAWLVGRLARQSGEYAEKLNAQAALQVVTAERLRIARELHDMVAHTIGIVALQSGAAKLVIETQPQRARTALGEVEAASRETLAGLRRMLGALRHAESEAGGEAEPPVQGLADLERLAATTTAAGVRVELHRQGEHRQLPAEIDLSAYRIVQESVTNVVRHSAARTCQVTIDHTHDTLTVEITDPGPTATRPTGSAGSTSGTGYGLLGMRERVTLLHGEFTAAPHQGGFRVTARLPLPTGT
ncbi:sensor histidine kinase [Kitasatospora sp. McL0602]|uniref:sensor histidine kinase n=1 Tax=Kitasatospora sp. McL0602 TaxID=3439530 RepID=UPI003F8B6AFF